MSNQQESKEQRNNRTDRTDRMGTIPQQFNPFNDWLEEIQQMASNRTMTVNHIIVLVDAYIRWKSIEIGARPVTEADCVRWMMLGWWVYHNLAQIESLTQPR